jgi:hypothetical protein
MATPSQPNGWVWWHTFPSMPGSTDRWIVIEASPVKPNLISKVITNTKRAGRVALVLEHLPSQCEALISNSSASQEEKNSSTY